LSNSAVSIKYKYILRVFSAASIVILCGVSYLIVHITNQYSHRQLACFNLNLAMHIIQCSTVTVNAHCILI